MDTHAPLDLGLNVDELDLDPSVDELDLNVDDEIEADAAAIVAGLGADAALVLTADQRAILEFERQWWRRPGAKEQAIRDNFEISPTRYYQALNAILDLPQAVRYDPTLVHRLQRVRTAAVRTRRPA